MGRPIGEGGDEMSRDLNNGCDGSDDKEGRVVDHQ
jgi:hypothetical protein